MSFTARFYGRCPSCQGNLQGEQVKYTDDGELVHDECNANPDEVVEGELCTTCFIVKSLTGECPNCD